MNGISVIAADESGKPIVFRWRFVAWLFCRSRWCLWSLNRSESLVLFGFASASPRILLLKPHSVGPFLSLSRWLPLVFLFGGYSSSNGVSGGRGAKLTFTMMII